MKLSSTLLVRDVLHKNEIAVLQGTGYRSRREKENV